MNDRKTTTRSTQNAFCVLFQNSLKNTKPSTYVEQKQTKLNLNELYFFLKYLPRCEKSKSPTRQRHRHAVSYHKAVQALRCPSMTTKFPPRSTNTWQYTPDCGYMYSFLYLAAPDELSPSSVRPPLPAIADACYLRLRCRNIPLHVTMSPGHQKPPRER